MNRRHPKRPGPGSRRRRAAPLLLVAGLTLASCGAPRAESPPVPPSPQVARVADAAAPGPTSSSSSSATQTTRSADAGLGGDTVALAPLPSGIALGPAPAPVSTAASTKSVGAWAACTRRYRAAGRDPSSEVALLARSCEKETNMKLVGKTLAGKQADRNQPEAFPLEAKANHCYRVYAQGERAIRDLDVAIRDSAGILVGQDATDEASAIVLEDGAVCFRKDDPASVVVSVGLGEGAYAVQVWGD